MKPRSVIGLSALALGLATASVAYQRVGPTRPVEGEGFCPGPGSCPIPVLAGGFPLPYLLDNPQISVPNALSPIEDDFRPVAFGIDAAFYLGVALVARGVWRRRRRTAP